MGPMNCTPPVVLTIAGTDPSGGAGIQADLRTFQALRVAGASVVTAALAQNSTGVNAIHPLPPRFVALQIDSVAKDTCVAATKIGMLCNERIVSTVANRIGRRGLMNVVLDPVVAAKDGRPLLTPRGLKRLIAELLPRSLVITPNLPEAASLAGVPVENMEGAREAARAIHGLGPRYVIIKGGHSADASRSVDLLFDGESFDELTRERIAGKPMRGTGCIFSAALAAFIAKGLSVPEAFREAKAFVTLAISSATQVGKGHPMWIG